MANLDAPSSEDSSEEVDKVIDKSVILSFIDQGQYEEAKQNLLIIIKKINKMLKHTIY
jgi:putative IMPACT (imprinted ancient) family translation regulator